MGKHVSLCGEQKCLMQCPEYIMLPKRVYEATKIFKLFFKLMHKSPPIKQITKTITVSKQGEWTSATQFLFQSILSQLTEKQILNFVPCLNHSHSGLN
jgi:hypothetical protein